MILFIALAQVRSHCVQCSLFDWSAIDRVVLNGHKQFAMLPEIDSVYNLKALHDGANKLTIHAKSIAPEHMQVTVSDDWGLFRLGFGLIIFPFSLSFSSFLTCCSLLMMSGQSRVHYLTFIFPFV